MLNPQKMIIEQFVKLLRVTYHRNYSILEPQSGNIIAWAGRLALENIANSDALYHDVEHTIMVTSVGQAILEGKHLCEGGVTPRDWLHVILALLCHDIGYVKGICRADHGNCVATGNGAETMELSSGGTDALLAPYHVARSKLFVQERFGKTLLENVDADLVASYIEITRIPQPTGEFYADTKGFPGLVRAADYIGQLGDPSYLRKLPALFYEFEELGLNAQNGFHNPGDMRRGYAKFYWQVVSPFIQDALRFLQVTQEGKRWIANLHSHVFHVEHQQV